MLDTTMWIAQSFVALFFFLAGAPKVLGRGIERWVGFDDLPRALVVVIGVCEIAAAVALVAPMLADYGAWTVPVAAIGLVAVSLMASGFHLRQGEWVPAIETALWAALAAAIAVGRWDEIATGPSISIDLLVPAVSALMPAIILILVVLFRQPVQPVAPDHRPLVPAR